MKNHFIQEEVSLEIPEVDKVFDVFDLSMPQFSEGPFYYIY